MGLFKKLSGFFRSPGGADAAGYWVYVRCNKCQETLKTRINLNRDLTVDYEGPHGQSYFTRKTIVGSSGCFQRIEIELTFNTQRKLMDREISGGLFIDEDDYLASE